MKFECILKVKYFDSDCFHQIGKIVVPPEYLKAQIDAYNSRVKKMDICNHVVLVNQLSDDGEFEQVIC